MPSRRINRRRDGRGESVAALLASRALARLVRRPVDTFALVGAAAATMVIIVNAIFLQTGAHPAPFVANSTPQMATADKSAAQNTLKPTDLLPVHAAPTPALQQAAAVPLPQPAPRRNDPIADLIAQSPRILAVQRVLSQYGYGQIKPTGVLDDATSGAIERFEREHKMPVDGRISDRLVSELNAMTAPAHPID